MTEETRRIDRRLLFNKETTALLVGISTQAFSKWGLEPHERNGREALYYWPDVQAERDRRLTAKVTGPLHERVTELEELLGEVGADPERGDGDGRVLILDEERARLASEQADKVAMENAVTRGELVYASQMAQIMGKALTAFRARLLAAAVKLAPRVNPGNPNLARELIDAEHTAALAELADFDPGQWMGDGQTDGDGDLFDPPAAAEANGKPVGRSRKKAQ